MMKKPDFMTWVLVPFLTILAFGLVACGDVEDDDDGSGMFVPDTSDPPGNSIYLELNSHDNNTITLAVKAEDLSNVYGIWFNLNFDGNIFSYINATEGSFLNQNGSTFFFATGKTSTVVVGITRQADAAGVSGSGTVCLLTFDGIAEGTSRFDFSLNSVADPNGNINNGVLWYGGLGTVVM
ncbi:hypothetical protein JXA40_07510 [bacterium]|nr:hypothetical protein [candidate division CSSED10-310 bacterium]